MDTQDPDSIAAVAGLNFNATGVAGGGRDEVEFLSLPFSGTDSVLNLTELSNVGKPGVWIFKVDEISVRGTYIRGL